MHKFHFSVKGINSIEYVKSGSERIIPGENTETILEKIMFIT